MRKCGDALDGQSRWIGKAYAAVSGRLPDVGWLNPPKRRCPSDDTFVS